MPTSASAARPAEEIQSSALDDGEDTQGFSLTTSREFCNEVRRRKADVNLQADCLEALDFGDELEDTEELRLLLSSLPAGLRSRYCQSLRSELVRLRVARAKVAELQRPVRLQRRPCSCRNLYAAFLLVALIAVARLVTLAFCAVQEAWEDLAKEAEAIPPEPSKASAQRERPYRPKDLEFLEDLVPEADRCADELGRAEEDAAEIEALSRRDILGYQRMLSSVHDWSLHVKRQAEPAVLASLSGCLNLEGARYIEAAVRLKESMLASHARAARHRGRLSAERQARMSLRNGRRQRCSWKKPSPAAARGAHKVEIPSVLDEDLK